MFGESQVQGRLVAARPLGHCPPTFQHESRIFPQKSRHIPAKEPCIPSRKSPPLPPKTKPRGCVQSLYLKSVSLCIYVFMYLCIYVSMYLCRCAYVCTYILVFLCIYVCIYASMHLCISVSICPYAKSCLHTD